MRCAPRIAEAQCARKQSYNLVSHAQHVYALRRDLDILKDIMILA